MLPRDLLLVAATAAISSFLTYFAMGGNAEKTPPVSSSPHPVLSAVKENQDKPTHKPNGKTIDPLTGGKTLALAAPPEQPQKKDGATGQQAVQDPSLQLKKQHELEENFSEFFERKSSTGFRDLTSEIENRFYLEEWDQAWAQDKESNILNLFHNNKSLNDITPLNITCRSKNCQVVLAVANQDQVKTLSEKFMQVAANGDIGMTDHLVTFFPDVSSGRLVFYLSENGNMDLFQ